MWKALQICAPPPVKGECDSIYHLCQGVTRPWGGGWHREEERGGQGHGHGGGQAWWWGAASPSKVQAGGRMWCQLIFIVKEMASSQARTSTNKCQHVLQIIAINYEHIWKFMPSTRIFSQSWLPSKNSIKVISKWEIKGENLCLRSGKTMTVTWLPSSGRTGAVGCLGLRRSGGSAPTQNGSLRPS